MKSYLETETEWKLQYMYVKIEPTIESMNYLNEILKNNQETLEFVHFYMLNSKLPVGPNLSILSKLNEFQLYKCCMNASVVLETLKLLSSSTQKLQMNEIIIEESTDDNFLLPPNIKEMYLVECNMGVFSGHISQAILKSKTLEILTIHNSDLTSSLEWNENKSVKRVALKPCSIDLEWMSRMIGLRDDVMAEMDLRETTDKLFDFATNPNQKLCWISLLDCKINRNHFSESFIKWLLGKRINLSFMNYSNNACSINISNPDERKGLRLEGSIGYDVKGEYSRHHHPLFDIEHENFNPELRIQFITNITVNGNHKPFISFLVDLFNFKNLTLYTQFCGENHYESGNGEEITFEFSEKHYQIVNPIFRSIIEKTFSSKKFLNYSKRKAPESNSETPAPNREDSVDMKENN